MKLVKIFSLIERYMIILVFIVSIIVLFFPKTFIWLPSDLTNYLLILIICMGLTLKYSDFNFIFKYPKNLGIGFLSQFLIIPSLAFIIGSLFNLETALFAGLIVVGTCLGGTASTVITYLSKGDVALSVGMTSFNTLVAPILTPFLTFIFLKTRVNTDVFSMFLSIIEIVIIHIILGVIINYYYGDKIKSIEDYLPSISILQLY